MNRLNNVVFPDMYPSLDLHGFNRDSARVAIDDFILDHYKMGDEIVTVVHGRGSGILMEETAKTLKNNKLVLEYKLDNFNNGMTLILIKKKEV